MACLGVAWARLRIWRMRNPLVWFMSHMREDAGLNMGSFISGSVVILGLTQTLNTDLDPDDPYFLLAFGISIVFFGVFSWYSFFVQTTDANSTPPLFYRPREVIYKNEPVAAERLVSPTKPSMGLDRFRDEESVEFKVLKYLYYDGHSDGVSTFRIAISSKLKSPEVKAAVVELENASLIEQVEGRDGAVEGYRLTDKGVSFFTSKPIG